LPTDAQARDRPPPLDSGRNGGYHDVGTPEKEEPMPRMTRVSALAALLVAAASFQAVASPATESRAAARDVRDFDKVELATAGALLLTQGEAESLEISASAEDLDRISTVVRMGTLHIGQVRPGDPPRGKVTYRLTMRKVSSLRTASSGSISAQRIDADALEVSIASSGAVSVQSLNARSLEVAISSSGGCTLAGTVDSQKVRLTSSGDYNAADLASRQATLELSSSGGATVRASEALEARLTSSGGVRFRGSPRVSSSITSSGKLIRID
jgi:hypothetical protein